MGAINLDNSGSGSSVVLTSNGTSLLLNGTAVGGSTTVSIVNKTAAYTVVAGDAGKIINCTSGSFTVALTAAATLGSGFTVTIWNTSTTGTDVITIDPNGTETIDGNTTYPVYMGNGLSILCDGTNWQLSYTKAFRAYSENMPSMANNKGSATGGNSFTIGAVNNFAQAGHCFALGSYANVGTACYGSLAVGFSTTTSGNTYQSAIGANSGGSGSTTATNGGAMALGGSYASGADSFAAAIASNANTYGATGANSIAIGLHAKASSDWAIAIGKDTVSSYYGAIAMGNGSTASGLASIALGQSPQATANGAIALGGAGTAISANATANGVCSVAISGGLANQTGKFAYTSTKFSSQGDAQFGKLVLSAETSTTTAVVLVSDKYYSLAPGASTSNQLVVASNQAMTFTGLLIAKQTASANIASYTFKGAIVNNAGTVTISSISVETILDTIVLDVQPTYTVDSTNKALAITSGYKAATSIRWVAYIDSVEVTYA